MIIAVDFEGTLVSQPVDAADEDEFLELHPDARFGLDALKAAGHVLVLVSCRANRARRLDWKLDPLWLRGAVPFDKLAWERERSAWQASYERMVSFVERELPGVFDAIDDGRQGKVDADLYIDDKALRAGHGVWRMVADNYGEESWEDEDQAAVA